MKCIYIMKKITLLVKNKWLLLVIVQLSAFRYPLEKRGIHSITFSFIPHFHL